MNLDEQLKALLAGLGVEMEREGEMPFDDEAGENDEEAALSPIALFQASKDHYGVFYRLDLIEKCPHLRVFLPVNSGVVKMEGYLVVPAESSPLQHWFDSLAEHQGSPEFETEQDTMSQHLLFAVGEMLKRLFWSGDLAEMQFPGEIVVERIL